MAGLWFYLEDMDEELYEDEETPVDERFINGDDEDVICTECGAIVEDGIQCQICGLIIGF